MFDDLEVDLEKQKSFVLSKGWTFQEGSRDVS